MARSVNKVILIGNIGQDPETKHTTAGIPVTTFSVATSRRYQDKATGEWKDETNWSRVKLWRNENVLPYLTKGTRLYVEGRLETRQYEDKDGAKRSITEVIAEEVMLLGGRGEGGEGGGMGMREGGMQSAPRSAPQRSGGGAGMSAASAQPKGGYDDFGDPGISDDDVPF